jgi:exosortase A-associated hydrolase 2
MNPGKCSIKADFLDCQGRKLFYLLLEPSDAVAHSSVLFLPPFTEEMNMSRRIVASQARSLAAAGYNVMLLDLTGCGDSGGDFADSSWQIWLEDASFAAQTLADLGTGKLILWGLRLGALLACEVSQGRSDIDQLLLWQPVLNGEQQLDQLLRLHSVASALNGPLPFDRKSLWNELRSGRSLDIAGYELCSIMAREMAKVRLSEFYPGCPVSWLEIGTSRTGEISVASEKAIKHWRERGTRVNSKFVPGVPFWRTVDACINQDLQRDTLSLLSQK